MLVRSTIKTLLQVMDGLRNFISNTKFIVVPKGEAASCDEGARNFVGELVNLIKEEQYLPKIMLNHHQKGIRSRGFVHR